MRILFHGLRLFADVPRTDIATVLKNALDGPLVASQPVEDAVGMTYAYDVVLQDGFYLFFSVLALWLLVRNELRKK